jgi:hypothetical protein
MKRVRAWTVTFAIGLAAPCAAVNSGFTYRLRDGKWLIVDHHSSSVPAAPRQ